MNRILVFGTFDGVHDGHRAMLREAKVLGGYLVVAVAPDSVVKELKAHAPHHAAASRITLVKAERIADEVILADESSDSWQIIKRIKPTIIALGYDQYELRASLEGFLEGRYPDIETAEGEWQTNPKKPRIVVLSAHKPETHHNLFLNKK